MKSFTFTVHGLGKTFEYLFKHFGTDPAPFKKNKPLSEFVLDNAEHLSKDKLRKLKSWCRTGVEAQINSLEQEMENWIINKKRTDSIKPKAGEILLFSTVYDFDEAWKQAIGEQNDIRGYRCFGANGYYNDRSKLAFVETKAGDTLVFWYTRKRKPIDLYKEAVDNIKDIKLAHSKDEIILPFIDFEEGKKDYGLAGWKITELTEIVYCTYDNWFFLDNNGAKARSITRTMAKTKGARRPVVKPKRIVFNKPFAAAVFEKDAEYPAIVSFCDKDCWIKK